MLHTMKEAEDLVYQSYLRAAPHLTELNDAIVRRPELTRKLLDSLGSPDHGQKIILVTGSKGKGSTSRFISSLLAHAGLKVGLFTSPHLVHFNERIRINGKAITDQEFISLANKVYGSIQDIEAAIPAASYQGPVGIALSIALLYFKQQKTDINVIECGRGGRFDDTNVIKNEWAVITPIMEEHLANLGPSIKDIIFHKLGIIKEGTRAVFIGQQEEHLQEIKNGLKELSAQCFIYGEDFCVSAVDSTPDGLNFDTETGRTAFHGLHMPLLGRFQAANAALAIKAAEEILCSPLDAETVSACFQSMVWPGRCEVISRQPTILLDGAIHRKAAEYVKDTITTMGARKVISITAVPANKDYKGVLTVLSEFSKRILITKPDISHLPFPEDAKEFAESLGVRAEETDSLESALALARHDSKADVILIIGTQTLIANAKRLFGQSLLDIGK